MIEDLSKPEVRTFIQDHLNDDPAVVTLSAKDVAGVDIKLIAEQIKARQKALKKLPLWADNPAILFPSALAVEQASSAETADYKASLVKGELCIDLTGGLGVDTVAFSKKFKQVIYVESDPEKVEAAKYNFKALNSNNITVIHATAEQFLDSYNEKASLIYIDPDRRPGKKKVLSLEESLPNVVEMKDKLLSVSEKVMIKASPMIDISATVKLFPETEEVHTLAINNECKELLFLISKNEKEQREIMAANLLDDKWEEFKSHSTKQREVELSFPLHFLYEPNAAILKSGLQDSLAVSYELKKLHPSTNLFTSEILHLEYPGRKFKIEDSIPVNKKDLKRKLPELKANLSTRNFPEHVDKLKKKLGIKDGGNFYIFACRLRDKSYKLLLTKKAV